MTSHFSSLLQSSQEKLKTILGNVHMVNGRIYRKSSITPPWGTYLFQTHLRGLCMLAKTMVEKLKYKKLEVMQPRIKKSELSAVAYTIPDQSTRSFRVIYKWRITRGKGGRLKREGAGLINFLPRKRRALIRERGKDTREKKDRRKKFLVSLPRLTLHFSPSFRMSVRLTAHLLD